MLLMLHTCAAFMVVNIVIFLIMLWLNPIEDDNYYISDDRGFNSEDLVMLKTVLTVI